MSPEQIITPPLLSKAQVTRLVRQRMTTLLIDASGSEPGAAAIYTLPEARAAERASIYEHLGRQLPLLNVETEILDRQIPLI